MNSLDRSPSERQGKEGFALGTLLGRVVQLSWLARYGVALAATALATLLRLALDPLLGPNLPLIMFFPAITVGAWFGGLSAGVVTTLLSAAAADYFWMTPVGSFAVDRAGDLLGLLIFVGVGFMISGLNEAWRRAGKALSRSEERLRSAFGGIEVAERRLRAALDAGHMGTWEWTIATGELKWSSALEAIHGFAPGSFTGTFDAFQQELHPDDRDGVLTAITEAVEQRRDLHIEYRIVRPDGAVHWLEGRGQLFYGPMGQPDRLVGVCSDVTERKQADERFRLAIEAAPNAMITVDAHGKIVLINAYAEQLFGYAREELLGQPIEMLVPSRFQRSHPEYRAGFFADPRTRPMGTGRDLFGVRKDGSEVPVEIGLNPIQTDAGALVLAAVVDISKRKRAEHAVREGEERLRLAVEAAQLGTWDWNIATDEMRWSAGLEAIHGLAAGTFLGTFEAHRRDVHPEDREIVRQAMTEALDQADHRVEYRIVRPDGEVRWVEQRGRVLYDAGGRPERILGIGMDVTDVKRAAEKRERLLEQEKGLLAREHAAKAEAVAANRAKDDFLAMVSHELRTPLNAIYGWTRMLRLGQVAPGKIDRALESVEHNAAVLAQLVSDLLDVSRVIAGKLHIEMRPVDLGATVDEAVDSLRGEANAKGVLLDVKTVGAKGVIRGDPLRLRQIITNVVSNAIKFTSAQGHVEVSIDDGRDGRLRLTVRDTGQGIAPEALPSIFDRFRQGSSGDQAAGRCGLGLGLAIVRHLVELHGGTVVAESPGKGLGATFTVELPRLAAVTHGEQVGTPLGWRPQKGRILPRLSGLRVLVVDDHWDSRDMIAATLRSCGAEVLDVGSTREALGVMNASPVDVVISDLSMPHADGYKLIGHLQDTARHRRTPPIPVIAVTAYADSDELRKAASAGFQMCLVKPVEPSELAEAVARLTAPAV